MNGVTYFMCSYFEYRHNTPLSPTFLIPSRGLFYFAILQVIHELLMFDFPKVIIVQWSASVITTSTFMPQNRSELILYTFRGCAFTLLKVIRWS